MRDITRKMLNLIQQTKNKRRAKKKPLFTHIYAPYLIDQHISENGSDDENETKREETGTTDNELEDLINQTDSFDDLKILQNNLLSQNSRLGDLSFTPSYITNLNDKMFSWEHCRKDLYEDVKSEMLMEENQLFEPFLFPSYSASNEEESECSRAEKHLKSVDRITVSDERTSNIDSFKVYVYKSYTRPNKINNPSKELAKTMDIKNCNTKEKEGFYYQEI